MVDLTLTSHEVQRAVKTVSEVKENGELSEIKFKHLHLQTLKTVSGLIYTKPSSLNRQKQIKESNESWWRRVDLLVVLSLLHSSAAVSTCLPFALGWMVLLLLIAAGCFSLGWFCVSPIRALRSCVEAVCFSSYRDFIYNWCVCVCERRPVQSSLFARSHMCISNSELQLRSRTGCLRSHWNYYSAP